MNEDQLAVADALLRGRVGLNSEPVVRARLARCLEEGAGHLDLTLDAYLERIARDETAFQELLDRVTVQHSYFFRDPDQFLALAELLKIAPRGPATIWSAAGGNGQEAYSLAMLLDEIGREDWRILATDVSSPALARARAGHYGTAEVYGVSAARMVRHFTPSRDGWDVVARLRERVDVVRHNLSTARPPLPGASFPVIFCRNVLIYFDPAGVEACVKRLRASLVPGGHLFLGYAEVVDPGPLRMDRVRIGEAFAYRRRDTAARAVDRPKHLGEGRELPGQDPVSSGTTSELMRLLAEGERAYAARDPAGAVRAFRKAVYLDPDKPVGYFQLGTALESAGDSREARRAFAAARAALARSDPSARVAGLEGYSSAELGRAISAKLGNLHMTDVT